MRGWTAWVGSLAVVGCAGASSPPPSAATARAGSERAEDAGRAALEALGDVQRAAVVVLDPRNGRLLAAVGRGPAGDGEAFRVAPTGSTWKTLTVAAALDAGLDPERRFPGGGGVYGEGEAQVRDHAPSAWLDARRTLVESSNVGAAHIVEAVGPEPLLRLVDHLALRSPIRVGDREAAGVRFGGPDGGPEAEGGGASARRWAGGIGVEGSLVHLAFAYAAVAHGGIATRPTRDGSGEATRVLSAESARRCLGYLEDAVEEGTGRPAGVDGLRVGGKTGTARLPRGEDEAWLALFVGVAPVARPRYVVAVRVQRADPAYGGGVAGPVFRDVVRALASP
ncbi:MAG: penicillin-binding transpeptidase domain-containing protein [Sandaracinaceae bacterium]